MSTPASRRFRYGDELIGFTVRFQPGRKAQRIAIHVEPDGRVVVDAPQDAADEAVLSAMRLRAAWVSRQVADSRRRANQILPREYVSGETLRYLGRRYQLKVILDDVSQATARMRGGYIEVTVAERDPVAVHAALEAWYLGRASELLAARLEAVAAPLPWVHTLPAMRLQVMKRQWGSCSPAGRLVLNPHLVKASRECIDYVVLHELCHLRHHNHGPDFYRTLERHLPSWRKVKARLDGQTDWLTP